MSTILKALRRLEEDRRNEDERSLRERILSTESPTGPRSAGRRSGIAVLAGLLLLGVVGGVGWWMQGRDRAAPPNALAGQGPAVVEEPSAVETAEFAAVALPPVSAAPPVPSVVSPAPAPAAVPPPALGIAEDIGLVTRPPKAAAVSAPPEVARVSAPRPEPRLEPEPKPKAARLPEAVTASAPPIRKIERAPMPDFVVMRTVWHPEAARRVAMIRVAGQGEAKAFGEGEAMGVLEIVEIQPSAVLFRRDGVEIVRRIGR